MLSKESAWQLLSAEEIAVKKLVSFWIQGPEIRTELFEGDAKEYSYKTGKNPLLLSKVSNLLVKPIALNVAGGLDIYDDVEVGRSQVLADDELGLRSRCAHATREQVDGIIAKQKGANIPNTKIHALVLSKESTSSRFICTYCKRRQLVRAICEH